MTLKELSQLYYLNREIEIDQQRLDELEAIAASPSSPRLSDIPRGTGDAGSKTERLVEEIDDLKALIAAKQIQCIHERNRLERYIDDIPDSMTRMIFKLRFVNGLPWLQVAYSVGGGNTEASVKMACYRYLKERNKQEKAKK